ncbi:MAG: hypothetical protein PHG00_13315 [Methylococcales bacterium]|nr:hypothetical protein [Methylococcales bacterium]
MKKKIGRPPLRGEALTEAEKKRRQRAKVAIRNKVAEEHGYIPAPILLSKVQLLAIAEMYGEHPSIDVISAFVLDGLKFYLESQEWLTVTKSKSWSLLKRDDIFSMSIQATLSYLNWEEAQKNKSLKDNEEIKNEK